MGQQLSRQNSAYEKKFPRHFQKTSPLKPLYNTNIRVVGVVLIYHLCHYLFSKNDYVLFTEINVRNKPVCCKTDYMPQRSSIQCVRVLIKGWEILVFNKNLNYQFMRPVKKYVKKLLKSKTKNPSLHYVTSFGNRKGL